MQRCGASASVAEDFSLVADAWSKGYGCKVTQRVGYDELSSRLRMRSAWTQSPIRGSLRGCARPPVDTASGSLRGLCELRSTQSLPAE
ncbi:hypothetical protein L1887_50667 [Cichorium endivia]|nr:hypothetical protein L1887_50667 [Cichorium endivia]